MKPSVIIGLWALSLSLSACGQQSSKQTTKQTTTNQTKTMDLSTITHPTVKAAMEAFQAGDKSWYSFFTENPVMTDDGNTVDFKTFFENALGEEKFLTIDKIEDEGKTIFGNFKAGKWGTFKVFFKFHVNEAGKFHQLDIGQAKY